MNDSFDDSDRFGQESPTPWAELEASRARHEWRTLFLTLGDLETELARAWIHNTGIGGRPNLRRAGTAAGRLLRAADMYQRADLGRRSQTVWRYARLLHRARSAEAGIR